MKKVYILYGGVSSEHEIALRSARNMINGMVGRYQVCPVYISRDGVWAQGPEITEPVSAEADLVFETDLNIPASIAAFLTENPPTKADVIIPCIHGTYGEDGTIQGFLEMLAVPYVGNGILASAVCMDKAVANSLMEAAGVPKAAFEVLYAGDEKDQARLDQVVDRLGYPIFVKPANGGSSVGISKVDAKDQLVPALEKAFAYDPKVVCEAGIEGVELEVSVVGNLEVKASLAGAYETSNHFFDYSAKYHDPKTIRVIPYDLPKDQEEALRAMSIKAYKACGCQGFARVDSFLTPDGDILVNEINSFPGMTPSSLSADLWQATDGTSLAQMIDGLIELAQDAFDRRSQRSFDKESL